MVHQAVVLYCVAARASSSKFFMAIIICDIILSIPAPLRPQEFADMEFPLLAQSVSGKLHIGFSGAGSPARGRSPRALPQPESHARAPPLIPISLLSIRRLSPQ